jgi:hypothetical protein
MSGGGAGDWAMSDEASVVNATTASAVLIAWPCYANIVQSVVKSPYIVTPDSKI